jgi:subtilisin-like proprotein convertase family protein
MFSLVWNFTPPVASQSSRRQAEQEEQPTGPENYDIRGNVSKAAQLKRERHQERSSHERKQKKAGRHQRMKDARERLAGQIEGLRVKESDFMEAPEIVGTEKGRRRLTGRSAEAHERIVRRFLSANENLYGLTAKQVGRLRKRAEYTNPSGNLSWVSLEQRLNDIPVFQGELLAALTPEGELVQTTGALAPDVDEKELSSRPGISAPEAIARAAATIGVEVNPNELVLKESSEDGGSFVYGGGAFAGDTKIELVYFPLDSGLVALSWSMTLWQESDAFYTIVDAEDGQLFFRKSIADHQTQTATYSVYDSDSPAPLSPSNSLPSAPVQPPAVPRTTFTLISELASTDPWLNDGVTTTTGNNVDAGMDLVSPDGIDAASRPVSATRNFVYSYDPAPGIVAPGQSPTGINYRLGEIVNMFFWTNRYHDRLYQLGFTEAARNFQQNNYGRGGLGNDRVRAEGQDYSGTSNANFFTPADGSSGQMQMYIFDGPNPDRTSGLDQEILIHELTHGTSNRLHSNASGLAANMSRGMGEGWSDFYARSLLSSADEDVNGIYTTGGYSTLDITAPTPYTANYYSGIRRFPYAVKTNLGANGKPHNPLTFADIDAGKINLTDGAFPRGPIGSSTAHAVHNIGEVWCMALLEVRARLINRMGYAAGNQRMLQLVTDGMKLDPVNPTLLNGRDSILAASAASGGGAAEEADIWAGFATRGMGYGATVTPAATTPITVGESFDVPNLLLGTVTVASDSCDFGGYADPGEAIELAVQLNNPLSDTDATGATASIVGGGSASYGDISAGASETRNLTYTVPSSAACGDKITLTIDIDSSLGSVTKTYVLQVGAPTSIGSPISAGTGNVSIALPDVSTIDIPFNVSDTGFIGDVNVSVRLNHTFDGDLVLSLIAPDGTSVALSNNRGSSGDNFGTGANNCSGTPTVFDDSATNTIASGVAPFAASFKPDSPLSALNGKEMNGTWKLRVADTGAADVGTLGCVQLQITKQLYYCCGVSGTPVINAVPPATVVSESASPANNAPDPDETVTMSFPLQNVGTGLTSNLVATLQPGGGVNAPSGSQSYGVLSPIGAAVSKNFTFVPSGNCGDIITATFQLQDGSTNLGMVSFPVRLGSTVVGGTTGSNPASIAIPGSGTGASTGAPSNPYPSNINISGVTGTVTKVTATLRGFSHTFPGDVDILLVAPNGQKIILMSDMGSGTDAVNTNITFDDTAPAIGAAVVSGTFRPTNSGTGDVFPAPAPAAPYGSTLSVFNNLSPNGNWSLYVVDDAGTDVGSISGGWSLSITTADPFCAFSQCTLGVPADIVQANDAGACGAFVSFASPTITGSCGVVTGSHASGSLFPVGTTPVTFTGTRQDNSTTNAAFNVTVNDGENPSVVAPPNVSAANDANACSGALDPGTATAGDNCSIASIVGTRSDAQALNAPYPVGTTTITWTATDTSGNTASALQTVAVGDQQAPSITNVSASPNSLWPANHKMIDVTVSYNFGDNCTAASSITRSLSVSSNEPLNGTGDGDTAPDWEIIDANRLRLRAERAGGGTGRIYTITITATDSSGNTTTRNVAVTVPHNR